MNLYSKSKFFKFRLTIKIFKCKKSVKFKKKSEKNAIFCIFFVIFEGK